VVLALAGLVSLSAIGVVFLTSRQSAEQAEVGDLVAVHEPTASVLASADQDSDNDGLPDWKEALYGTDPRNPDSDGDGVSDSDEVAAGSNPAKEGTDAFSNGYTAPSGLPTSEALGREVFAAYLSLKQDGAFDDQAVGTAVESIVSQHLADGTAPQPRYTIKDIKQSSADDGAARASYRAKVDTAIAKADAVPEYELSTAYRLLDTEDLSHADTLGEDAKIYRAIANDLLALPVPASYAKAHLDLVNAFDMLAGAVSELSIRYSDPYDMLVAVNIFVTAEKQFTETYRVFDSLTAAHAS